MSKINKFDDGEGTGKQMHTQVNISDANGLTEAELSDAAAGFGLDLSGGFDAQLALAQEAQIASEALAAKACEFAMATGLHLLAAKSQYQHGDWIPYLESKGFDRVRASEFTRQATRWAQLSPDARKVMLGLGKKKRLALVSLDAETIEAAHESGELPGLAALSKSELIREVKKLTEKVGAEKIKRETVEARAVNAGREAKALPAKLRMPEFARLVRHEAVSQCEGMQLAVTHLEGLVDQHLPSALTLDQPDPHAEMAAGTLKMSLLSVQAQVQGLIAKISERFPNVGGSVLASQQLTEAELDHAKPALNLILLRHQQGIKNRDTDRKLEKRRAEGGAGAKPKYVKGE